MTGGATAPPVGEEPDETATPTEPGATPDATTTTTAETAATETPTETPSEPETTPEPEPEPENNDASSLRSIAGLGSLMVAVLAFLS